MAEIAPAFQYQATLVKVIDADTVDFVVDLGFRIYVQVRCRLYRINAPERYTAEGRLATAFLTALLNAHMSNTIIRTYKDPTDKYGRWVADVYVNGQSVSEVMVSAGHAVTVDY